MYHPSQLGLIERVAPPSVTAPAVPLLANRNLVGRKPTGYVCRDFACQTPVTQVEGLCRQLE